MREGARGACLQPPGGSDRERDRDGAHLRQGGEVRVHAEKARFPVTMIQGAGSMLRSVRARRPAVGEHVGPSTWTTISRQLRRRLPGASSQSTAPPAPVRTAAGGHPDASASALAKRSDPPSARASRSDYRMNVIECHEPARGTPSVSTEHLGVFSPVGIGGSFPSARPSTPRHRRDARYATAR